MVCRKRKKGTKWKRWLSGAWKTSGAWALGRLWCMGQGYIYSSNIWYAMHRPTFSIYQLDPIPANESLTQTSSKCPLKIFENQGFVNLFCKIDTHHGTGGRGSAVHSSGGWAVHFSSGKGCWWLSGRAEEGKVGGCVLIAGMEIAVCIGSIVDASTAGATTNPKLRTQLRTKNVLIRSKWTWP